MRLTPDRLGAWANLVACVAVAAGLSMIVRPVTAALTHTLGTVWPFSTVQCERRAAPGCDGAAVPARLGGRLGLAAR